MRLVQGFAAALILWGAAFAQENKPEYSVTIRSGVGYSFPHDEFGIPRINQSSIESAFTVGGTLRHWSLSASYLETDDNHEGFGVAFGYDNDDCPLVQIANLGCQVGIEYEDVGNGEAISYNAGLAGPIGAPPAEEARSKPTWSLGVSTTNGDEAETSVTGGIELPYQFAERWTVTAAAGLVHGGGADDTLPEWSVGLSYTIRENIELSFGYESAVVLRDDEEDELDVDRAAFVERSFKFGGDPA